MFSSSILSKFMAFHTYLTFLHSTDQKTTIWCAYSLFQFRNEDKITKFPLSCLPHLSCTTRIIICERVSNRQFRSCPLLPAFLRHHLMKSNMSSSRFVVYLTFHAAIYMRTSQSVTIQMDINQLFNPS